MTHRRHASTTGAWRLLRGIAVGSCASGIGALAHVTGGGTAPPIALLGLLATAVTSVCALASRWRWRLPSLVAVMLLGQLVFHLVFTGYAVHGAHAMHSAHAEPESAAPMAANHVVAAVGFALLLRFGETWLRGVVDGLGARLLGLVAQEPTLPPRAPRVVVPAADTAVVRHGYAGNTWSRGPPQQA